MVDETNTKSDMAADAGAARLSRKADPNKVSLMQMLKELDKDVAVNIEKKLKKLSKKKAIQKPLDKHKADKLERQAAYASVTKEVSQWEPIVEKNKKAAQIRFPLDQEPDVLPTTSETITDLKPANDFETQVQHVLGSSETALSDRRELSKAEEKYLKAISAEEAEERHKELQRMRVLLSSYAAKMRRQKAIKSKSYRRLLKHERIRKHVKNVEANEDLLMSEIEKLRRLRAQERASLKHKSTGKWAKHAKFRTKYDEDARNAMCEQIGIAKKLLEKPVDTDDSDGGESDSSDDVDDSVSVSTEIESNDEEPAPETKVSGPIKSRDVINSDRTILSSEMLVRRLNDIAKRKGSDDDDTEAEDENEDDQRRLMSEAFADDDVVAEFRKEKEKLADEEQPKDIDKFLPGWGDWAGPGIKISKNKRRKYIIKAEKRPRKDSNLGNVIISEDADTKLEGLMVKKLPRGVKNDNHLKKLLTQPTSATFVDQATHRSVTKPQVVTKLGARIEPINKRVLGSSKIKWTS